MTAPAGNETPEVEETEGTEGTESELSVEDLKKELAKVRKEAADRRVKARDLEAKAKELDELKQAQMSDLEKAQARVKELEETNSKTAREAAFKVAVATYDFEEGDLEFIHGDTPEEIAASAEKLSKRLGGKKNEEGQEQDSKPRNPNLFPGTNNRGTPVGGKNRDDANKSLRDQLWS